MTSMDGWTLFFVLLLPLTVCFDSEVTLEKTLGSKPDVTPLCNNTKDIKLIVCSIKTERSGGEQCRLLYRYGEGFHSSCDSRFILKNGSETALLHLTSLTPEDSGNYSCQCSYHGGTYIVHLNITVEEDEELSSSTEILIPCALTGAAVVIIITGVILGFIHKTKRVRSWSITSGLSVNETPGCVDQEDPDEPYMSLQQPTNELYETISSIQRQRDTNMTRSGSNV
ncbi:uncharacterized protein LOC111665289 [Seriola lalandi dorsalis]|uniref:uncharacterized protein LOC111665289 n=1 Tax=Seriola lalandi dorsalis TaxID=1841481 RepID=UPI000C6F4A8E|nr:uncharacterized protein LOC111665289 [Seriola lalandi dorsalis]